MNANHDGGRWPGFGSRNPDFPDSGTQDFGEPPSPDGGTPGWRFAVATRADGTKTRGAITLGIDGHKGHWVRGRFLEK